MDAKIFWKSQTLPDTARVQRTKRQHGCFQGLAKKNKNDDITDECVTLQQNKTSVSDAGLPKNLWVVLQERGPLI